MNRLFLAALLMSTSAWAAPKSAETKNVKCKEAIEKILKVIKVGNYKGTVPNKPKVKCEVSISQEKKYFTVEVDDLSDSVSNDLPCQLQESKTSIAMITSDEDGDETVGGYIFTRTSRVTTQEDGSLKVSEVEEKDYTDEPFDTETQIRSCVITR